VKLVLERLQLADTFIVIQKGSWGWWF